MAASEKRDLQSRSSRAESMEITETFAPDRPWPPQFLCHGRNREGRGDHNRPGITGGVGNEQPGVHGVAPATVLNTRPVVSTTPLVPMRSPLVRSPLAPGITEPLIVGIPNARFRLARLVRAGRFKMGKVIGISATLIVLVCSHPALADHKYHGG